MNEKRTRFGLTLLELVVVLAILTAITAAAAVATDRILTRKRHEVSQNTLASFRRSLLGRFGQAESITTVSASGSSTNMDGFIADMGRVPVAVGSVLTTQLSELWNSPAGVSAYGMKTAAGDPEVTLACGWRGPYLDLPIGSSGLLDGFGRELVVLSADGSGSPQAASAGEGVLGLTSLGSDGEVGVTTSELPLAEDLTVWLGGALSMIQSDLTVRVYESDGSGGRISPSQTGSLMVRLYLPDTATGDIAFQQSPLIVTPATAAFSFPAVPIGDKVLRAYWVSDSSVAINSPVMPIEVHRSGQTSFDIVLPPLPISP